MPAQTTREMQRMATELEIKAVARGHLAQDGVQDVTLRAVARAMGMTAPALYRYFPSLDVLVASMCDDFVEEITDAVTQAVATTDDPGHGLQVAARAVRAWAVEHRNEFAVMVRGDGVSVGAAESTRRLAGLALALVVRLWVARPFEAPAPAPGTDVARLQAFAQSLLDAAGPTPPGVGGRPSQTAASLVAEGAPTSAAPADLLSDLPPAVLAVFAQTWVRLAGVIGMEALGQLDFLLGDASGVFERELADAAAALGTAYLPPAG